MNTTTTASNKRRTSLLILAAVFALAGIGWGTHWYLHGRHFQDTDDAYVDGNLIGVTPRIGGTVTSILADDTDHVTQGQELVHLDDTDARLALEKAKADLAETVRQVQKSFESRDQQQANLAIRERALQQAQDDLARRKQALAAHAISAEEVEHAQSNLDKARAERDLARAQLTAAETEIRDTHVESHPLVKLAETRLREAWLAVSRCAVYAPASGVIAKRSVQIGQQVTPGMPLMAIVPTSELWVEANFKEDQLRAIRAGQPVQLISDIYGDSVVFHGTVVGLSPGTGSVFSLLPAQNASGNWIKIVQRVPVRIALDPKELDEHPLRVGLSLKAEVDTSASGGSPAPQITHYQAPMENTQAADAMIANILKSNLARKG